MIDFDYARETFETYINATLAGCPVAYEGAPDNAAVLDAKKTKKDWIRVTVKQGKGLAADIGTNARRRYVGLIMISLFTDLNKGTKPLRDRASTIADSVVKHQFQDILIRTPELTIMGKETDWFMADLTIPFELDQFTL